VTRKRAASMPQPAGPVGLAARWRQEARLARELGAVEAAQALERCASQLDVSEREHALELLTLQQASDASGVSYSTLQHAVAAGRIKNAGTRHRPRIRRADLPRKVSAASAGQGLADRVLAARHRRPA